jgi:HlyD family secretion protein
MHSERRFPKWQIAVALGVVLVLAVVGWRHFHGKDDTKPAYETQAVDRGAIVARVTATGTLSALVTVTVGSQVSGRLAQINVDFNSPVTKGEVIAVIDPQLYEAALEQAKASSLSAAAALTKAQVAYEQSLRELKRSKALAEQHLVALADLDTAQSNSDQAKAQVEVARASVAQASANLHQAQVNLGYTKIVSPINGTVISRAVDVGQTVAASLQAPTLFTIAEDLKRMQVDTNVAEADVGKLASGMTTTFTVDAYPHRIFRGRIRQIRNAPQTVSNVVTYDAVIDVDNPDLSLKPGMTANVTIVYADQKDVLRVPNAALRFQPMPGGRGGGRGQGGPPGQGGQARQGGGGGQGQGQGQGQWGHKQGGPEGGVAGETLASHKAVYVLRDNQPVRVPITIGVTDGTSTEVQGGELNEGDAVITGLALGAPAGGAPGGGGRPLRF